MKATMDKAGRIVIPAALRERLGMIPGPVDLIMDGTGIRIEVETHDNVVEKDGLLVITGGPTLTDDDIRELRLGNQR
ncbi:MULTISPECIES: AbrB/MazE/SpoVT family DNA-binding domain-containing protein [Microbacterium]|uniref:AbrB/MazE/SpoVT family DNA-binding domain-containing protein n=2 Tax=Microbacterium TaxID=33882 RepID=A0ABV3LI79_9MICO|nr:MULTISPECIES: AbrB/MazE/SpoVT family DNA-binding domain-containing protein [Microbacterium]MCE7481480.1 AbrB/MazE/SpoVT family DNA-binding domain-containing protein [Microbacterium profundi]